MVDVVPVLGSDSATYNIATDTVGGSEYQRLKNGYGADGSYTDVAPATGLPVAPQFEEVTGTAAANNTDLVASKDVRAYRTANFQLTGTWTATVSAQGSNDGTTWTTLSTYDAYAPAVGYTTRTSNGTYYSLLSGFRYFRLRTTAYTSGTVVATTEFTAQAAWYLPNISNTTIVYSYTAPADGMTSSATVGSGADLLLYNGATWDRGRTPNIFKSVASTASGNSAIWTPTSGKKFRLMKYMILMSSDAATTGGARITIDLQDATTSIGLAVDVFVPATAGATFGNGFSTGWIDLGNGKLSAAINQVLNCNLSAALSSGTCRVVACGTEE